MSPVSKTGVGMENKLFHKLLLVLNRQPINPSFYLTIHFIYLLHMFVK